MPPRVGCCPAAPPLDFSAGSEPPPPKRFGDGESAVRLWNYNLDALDRRAAAPVLSGQDNGLTASRQRRGKIFERAVAPYVRDLFAVDNKRRAGLRAPADLYHVTMQLGTSDLQQHLLTL